MRCRSGRGEREVGVIFKKGFSSVLVGEGRKRAEQSRAEQSEAGGRAKEKRAGRTLPLQLHATDAAGAGGQQLLHCLRLREKRDCGAASPSLPSLSAL